MKLSDGVADGARETLLGAALRMRDIFGGVVLLLGVVVL
jgi:hypothetical protein